MSKTTYTTSASNGKEYAERIADHYRSQGYSVTVKEDRIPQWGSGNPHASNYGCTEAGFKIEVCKKK